MDDDDLSRRFKILGPTSDLTSDLNWGNDKWSGCKMFVAQGEREREKKSYLVLGTLTSTWIFSWHK
jgi:hypothetical protein